MNEFNKDLCEERHDSIEKTFSRVFEEIKGVTKMWNRFLIVTLSTLIAVILNIILTFANGGK